LAFALPVAAQSAPTALPDSLSFSLGSHPQDNISISMDKLFSNDSGTTGSTISSVGVSARGVTPTINVASSSVMYPIFSLMGSSLSGVYVDTFEYTVSNPAGSSTSYVSITLLNSAPQASDMFLQIPPSAARTSFALLLGGSYSDGGDCDDSDSSTCSYPVTVESPPACGSLSSTIEGLVFTATDGGGLSCPSDVYIIPYHVTDPWGLSSNTAFFHIVHELSVGQVISSNGSLDTVVRDPVQKMWLPANFKFSGSLMDQRKVKTVTNPLYESSGLQGVNPLYCGETDHLRAVSPPSSCTCKSGYSGADCGIQITNVPGGTLKMVQTMPPVMFTDADTLSFEFVVNSHTSAFDLSRMSAKVSVVGTSIVFTCSASSELLSHELAHVVQQSCTRPVGDPIPGGAPVTLKAIITYKTSNGTGTGTGKVSLQDFHFVVNGQTGFSRPGDVFAGSSSSRLPLPPSQ